MTQLTVGTAGVNTEALLDDWQWLLRAPHEVLLLTAMGDAFLATRDDAVVFLDTLEGRVIPVSSSREAFFSLMNSGCYDPDWFNPDMVEMMQQTYGHLPQGHCYAYKLPPVVGGSFESANVEPTSLVVHFSVSGQLHRQIKNFPEGAAISRFVVVEDPD